MAPLIHLLRICDSNDKPTLGYVYKGMYRTCKSIKKLFKGKKRSYKLYADIINNHWDKMLRQNIYACVYWLNPTFQYDQNNFCQKPKIMLGLLDVIETKAIGSKTKLLDETLLFREHLKNFGWSIAIISCKTTQPNKKCKFTSLWLIYLFILYNTISNAMYEICVDEW